MADGPGTLEEKLMAHKRDHYYTGKEYDEAGLRRTLGLPAVPNPEHLPESPERKRLVRLDDREAKREAEEATRQVEEQLANQRRKEMLESMKDQQILDMQRQIAELRAAQGGPEVTVTAPKAKAEKPPAPSIEGGPNESWNIAQMKTWLEQQGYEDLPRKGVGMSRVAALEHCLEQQAQNAEA
jgi:hypothetical protein